MNPESLWVVTAERGQYSDWRLIVISAHHRKDQADDAVRMLEGAQSAFLGYSPGDEPWTFHAEELAGKSAVKEAVVQILEDGDLE